MSKAKLIQAMKQKLDETAQNYARYTQDVAKEIYKKAYRNEVLTINILLENLYGDKAANLYFTSSIDLYIMYRENENWE